MARFYWFVNSNRSRVKRFIENKNNKDQFFKYMFIDYGKVYLYIGQRTTSNDNKRRMEKINCSGLEKN